MRKLKAIRQPNQMDCGPTCIMIVAEYYGKSASLQTLRSFAGYNKDGVSLSGLADAAEKIGFQTTGVELTLSELMKEVALPAILHWRQNHFVVLGPKPKRTKLVVIDPARGKIDYTVQEFMEGWASNVNEANEPTGTALILQPTDAFYTATEEYAIPQSIGWNFLARYFSRYRKYFFQVILSLGIATLLQLIFPFLTQSIVDTGINSQDLNFITLVLIAQLMLFVSRTLVEFIRSRLLLYISTRINVSILSDFWGKIMRLPISYFDVQRTGDIMQRIGDHRRIEAFLTGPALSTVFSLFTLSVFSIVLLLYSPAIFWVFAGSSILYFLWVMIFLRYRKNLDFKKFDAASRENSITMELIQGVREIKLSASEHLKRWEWERIRVEQFKISFKSLSINQYQQSGAFFINEGKNIFITFLVARLVIDGQLTLGAMLAIQYIIGQLNSPIEQLIAFIQSAQDARISLNRLNDIHQVDDEEPQYRSFRFKLPADRTITIKNLSFSYPGTDSSPVLNNIDLDIPEGKMTAIVGMSGCGKTSILKLLLRFYDGYHGDIKIGGVPLQALSPRFFRTRCGSVLQDGYIFNDTIARNIAAGDENPDPIRIDHACKIACISTFVDGLPLGLNTKIGLEGNGISAGQKQRILIARAVYKDPDYFFLDESTNSLDAKNEAEILLNLRTFLKGKTSIVVAHRLSTIRDADNIVVLDKGRVAESGTHEELIANRHIYFDLIRNQLETSHI